MRAQYSLLSSLLLSGVVLAQPAISLQPVNGNDSLRVIETKHIIGSCGTSIVDIKGVQKIFDDNFAISVDGEVIVSSGSNKQLVIKEGEGILSDYNGIACVPTKLGSKLLIWSTCGGSQCGDSYNFYVIDPERLVYLAPKNPRKGTCDAECASKALGINLPQDINNRVNQ